MTTLRVLLIAFTLCCPTLAVAAGTIASGGGAIGGISTNGNEGDCLLLVSSVPTWGACPGAGSGAPTDAKYIVQTADATLSAEQALATLATGIMKVTTTTGVISVAVAGTDYPGLAFANVFTTAQTFQPATDVITGTFRRNGAAQTSNIIEIQTEANALLASIDKTGAITAPSFTANGASSGIVDINGVTSGKLRLTTADATAQTITVTGAAQTVGATTLTIPDMANTNDTFLFAAKAATLTNKTLDAEGPGNVLTIPRRIWLPAAGCNNATAGNVWDLPTSNPAVPACKTGTNTQMGVLDFADGSNLSAQLTYALPTTWTGTVDARIKWLTSATTGNVVWQIQTICVADAETDDPAFNTASTVTDAAKGTTLQTNDAAITGVTTTGCAAGELMHLKILRDSAHASDNLSATARLIGVELTIREAL